MSTTENRIVKMVFDNLQFKKAAGETSTQLAAIDKQVAAAGKGRGLMDMAGSMDTVRVKAGAMQVAVVTAIANIANRAVNAGINMVKSLSLDPIRDGFAEYESLLTKQNTIMNATGLSADVVKKALSELNEYSDKTIYSFGNMTESVQKFTNAGVSLPVAVQSITGIANAAAFAGASASEANSAMYAFAQAMGMGFIGLEDWNIIETANMGTIKFKEQLLLAGEAAGTLTKQGNGWVTSAGKFVTATEGWRYGLADGWATVEVMNTALGNYADTNTELGKKAFAAAQDVRTFTAFMDTLKESLASGWSNIFTAIFGGLKESTKMWTSLANTTGAAVGAMFGYVATLLQTWRDLGGASATIQTLKNLLAPFGALLGVIAKAWSAAFPDSGSGSALATFSKGLEHATRPLNVLAKLISGSLGPVTAFFRLLAIGYHGIRNLGSEAGKLVERLLGLVDIKMPSGGGGFIDFINDLVRAVGTAIEEIDRLIRKGSSFTEAFQSVSFNMPSLPSMPSLPTMPSIGSIFGGDKEAAAPMMGLAAGIDKVTTSVSDLGKETRDTPMFNPDADITAGRVKDLGTLEDQMRATEEQSRTLGDAAMPILERLKNAFGNFIDNFSFDDLMASFNLAVLSTFMISISRFFNTMSKSFEGFVGTGEAVNGILSSAGDALGSFQTAARAKLITAIAIAIGILAVSLWLLSKIPLDQLATGLLGLAGIMMIMKVGVDSIAKSVAAMEGSGTALKLTGLSLALLALGAAVLMLAGAFLILNYVDWQSMLKGLGTIVIVMLMMERLGKAGEHAAKNLVAGAFAISVMAGSMLLLAGALLLFKLVDWESMAKGGLVIAALTGILLLLSQVPAASLAKAGTAMLATSVGMLALANALLIFGLVQWESLGKAGVMLMALTVALMLLSVVGNPVTVAGVVGLSLAMIALATAGLIFNNVDWSSIGKLALVLGILVVAFAGFLAVMAIFTPVLIILSGFAGAIGFLALAITGLTLAFALVFPLLAAGAGVFAAFATGAAVAFAVFIQTLALQAPIIKNSFLKILQTLIDGIVEAVPMVIDGIKRLFEAVKAQFSDGGGGGSQMKGIMGDSGKSWIEKLRDGIIDKLPAIIDAGITILSQFLGGLAKRAKELGGKGAELVANLIAGIATKIGSIVDSAVNLIIQFAQGISSGLGRILEAGVRLIADFLHRLASTIRTGSAAIGGGIDAVVDAMKDVGMDIVKGMIEGVQAMLGDALGAIGDLASGMVNKAKSILDIFSPSRVFKNIGKFLVEGLTKGIQDNAAAAITATAAMVSGSISIASEYMSRFVQDLDQQAMAASARAIGLAAAAEKAARMAEKTKKNKKDDKAARKLANRAEKAAERAEKREERAEKAAERAERAEQFQDATLIERAEMRAEDAQNQIDEAKGFELSAASKLEQAKALREQAKKKGVNNKDAKEMRKMADRLEKQAEADAKRANTMIANARASATESMEWQRQAAAAAAADFQARYDSRAKEDADEAAFQKLTDEEKAAERRRQAAALQASADADLQRAKELAYTDLEAANELADEAIERAEQARQYLLDAEQYDLAAKQAADSQSVDTGGNIVNLDPTEAASIAFNEYAQRYDSGMAASAGDNVIEFNQYNTSPEYLSEADIYRRTNNQLDFAGARLGVPA